MNILHINYTDLAGGRFTGFYMKEELDENYKIEMAVWSKKSKNDSVNLLPPNNKILHILFEKLMFFFSRLGFDGLLGTAGWILPSKEFFKKADIIHIHLIHGFSNFSILSLPLLSRLKPMVWTLHDPWAITGGCEHSFECEKWRTGCSAKCPHPRCFSLLNRYTPFLHWRIKRWVYSRMNITIIVASDWMMNKVKKSPLMGHLKCKLIPFGIDLNKFRKDEESDYKKIINIPNDNHVIAFRNTGLSKDKFKGLPWIKEALEIYSPIKPTTLLIFENKNGFETLSNKYNIIYLGWIDGDRLINALCAADIFLMPSIQESFGLMAVEAMACLTPVIVFEGTALPSVIKTGGIIVESKNSIALSNALLLLLSDEKKRLELGKEARFIVENNYQYSNYVKAHISLYEKVIFNFFETRYS